MSADEFPIQDVLAIKYDVVPLDGADVFWHMNHVSVNIMRAELSSDRTSYVAAGFGPVK